VTTTILIVDDEPQIVRALRIALRSRGYEVLAAGTGEAGLQVVATQRVDVIVLDLGLPGIDGVEVTKRIRSFSPVPIVVLSVRESQEDKVSALDAGADDYLTKPFGMDELLARIRATLRRVPVSGTGRERVTVGEIEVDLVKRSVKRLGDRVHLTPTEFELIEAFVTHPGKLLTHRWLLDRIGAAGSESQYLRVYVGQLRRKLGDDPSRPRYIFTESGIGYRWADGS
jgi:two-component system, OmpR family, KDP operon response regulator KdpE